MTEQPKCELCGEPMPPGEEMFKYHGYSGNCPHLPQLAGEPAPPTVQFITYAYDEPDDAPVLDISRSIRQARRQGNRGAFLYRVELLPKTEWKNNVPAYGHEQFVEVLP